MAGKRRKKSRRIKVKVKVNRRWLIKTAIILCFLLLAFAGIYFLQKAKTFDVRHTNVRSNVQLNKSVLEHVKANSIFDLDLEFIADSLMKDNPEYRHVRIKRIFPREVVIEVDHRGYFAQIKGKMYYAVDRDGVVLSQGSNYAFENLIPIEYDSSQGNFKKGHRISDKRLMKALELIEVINREPGFSEFSVSLVNVANGQGGYFLIQPADGRQDNISDSRAIKIIVGENGYRDKIKNLAGLIKGELREKMSFVKYIDLRHRKIYVGFRR
jgi:hypothetical protein